ncbi:prepilin-type N-terminal cleavage/methylation domain-containing protein [Candidatus Uhrbacteria bacterium]|nr:prepilin-type N-terminal cleavage/methylation domain-containing protein [Candidatus Uhrbacteria bacterium]
MKKGFTILELLVSISIMATITVLVTANLAAGNRSVELRSATDNLASLIRKASVWSLVGHQINGQFPIGGYGVSIPACAAPPCKVTLFADLDGSLTYNSAGNLLNTPVSTQVDERVEDLAMGNFMSLVPPGQGIDLLFKPPQPTVCRFDRANLACPPVGTITIGLVQVNVTSAGTKNIDISPTTGQITVR